MQGSPAPERLDWKGPVVRSFRAHPSALHDIREFVRGLGEDEHIGVDALDDLVLAVSEACANAIIHTNSPTVEVACRFSSQAVEVRVRDAGVFRRKVPVPELGGTGRGIPMMMAVMDEVAITEGSSRRPGTLVRLVKRTDSAST